MQITAKALVASPLSQLKRWHQGVDRSHLVILLRLGVLLCLAASVQALYYQLTLPTFEGLIVSTVDTELVRTPNPRLYTLDLRINNQLTSIRGACSGYRKGEANIQGGEKVQVWQDHGEIYQIQNSNGQTYRANDDAAPCSLVETMDAAMVRPKISMWVAMFGAVLAMVSYCRLFKFPAAYAK